MRKNQLDHDHRVAAVANALSYDPAATRSYSSGAPHLKHAAVRELYADLVVRIFDSARRRSSPPLVLDLGAGEGSATLPFLRLGARVLAVDVSDCQLLELQKKCVHYGDMIELRCEDVDAALEALRTSPTRYDIVVASAFLHHVPDYLDMIRRAAAVLNDCGQFLFFQDPLRYDSLPGEDLLFSRISYAGWRLGQRDVIGGARRRLRRSRGLFLEDCPSDNVEFHALRGGVDQEAISSLCHELGMSCTLVKYFSTQSGLFQRAGDALGIKNTFGVVAGFCS